MLLLGLDFETTGLDLENDFIIEIGAVLWDTKKSIPLQIMSDFIAQPKVKSLSPTIISLTGITCEMLATWGIPPQEAFIKLSRLYKACDCVAAHNGNEFDRIFFNRAVEEYKINLENKKDWIDTRYDLPYNLEINTRKLSYLAVEHGFMNPFSHRALFDVLTTLKIISCYDINKVLALSKEPNVILRAVVDYNDRDLAKEKNYQWNSERKLWLKIVKESLAVEELKETKFPVVKLEK